ncbi:MAG: TlpA family protein disulfide reductase [bacterium]|nr:TlpA family protein disulfide reductase [bacterium]
MRIKTTFVTFLILLSSLIILGCGGEPGEIVEGFSVENNKFSFTLTDINGKKRSIQDLRGKGVVINVWATWCGPCIKEIPVINDLYNKYKDQGFEVWGIATDVQGISVVEPKIQELGVDYPNFIYKEAELLKIFEFLRGRPTTLFFDTSGEVVKRVDGEPFVDKGKGETLESWWEENIKAILPDSK